MVDEPRPHNREIELPKFQQELAKIFSESLGQQIAQGVREAATLPWVIGQLRAILEELGLEPIPIITLKNRVQHILDELHGGT